MSTLLSACTIFDFGRLQISFDPGDPLGIVDPTDGISVHFSRRVDPVSAEHAVQVFSAHGTVEHSTRWDTGVLKLSPVAPPDSGVRHTVQIQGEIVDERGTPHRVDTLHSFLFSTSATPVRGWVVHPDSQAAVLMHDSVVIRFAAPMNADSVEAAVTTEPQIESSFHWNPDRTELRVTPDDGWSQATVYTVRVAESAETQSGGQLAGGIRAVFASNEFSRPLEIEKTAFIAHESVDFGSGVEGGSGVELPRPGPYDHIRVHFSSPVDPDALRRHARFVPSIRFDVKEVGRRVHDLVPAERFAPAAEYLLVFSDDLRDRYSNRLARTETRTITPLSPRQSLSSVQFAWPDGALLVDPNSRADKPYTISSSAPDGTTIVTMTFEFPLEPGPDRHAVTDSVRIVPLLPTNAAYPHVDRIVWLDSGQRLRFTFSGLIATSAGSADDSTNTRADDEPDHIYTLRMPAGGGGSEPNLAGIEDPVRIHIRVSDEVNDE